MIDNRFYKNNGPFSLAKISEICGAQLKDADKSEVMIKDIASFTRENISMQMCGYKRKFLGGESSDMKCNISFFVNLFVDFHC